jgi:uncharacterized caspase-like protein
MLFLMDACYGGLAITRTTIPPGSMRFLKDMLQRFSRQVLTAGKANEVVSDSGGTRPGHSIFTSYLLDGMDGLFFDPPEHDEPTVRIGDPDTEDYEDRPDAPRPPPEDHPASPRDNEPSRRPRAPLSLHQPVSPADVL